jgi:UDP-glucuronate 4-epimerase
MKKNDIILVTGAAGFIGFSLIKKIYEKNPKSKVIGIDSLNEYYDVNLKKKRLILLKKKYGFKNFKIDLVDNNKLSKFLIKFKPRVIVHLAAQAGVRYSLKNPRSYINSNIVGTFNLLENLKRIKPKHILIASTSSVYGLRKNGIFKEIDKTDHQLSLYAATKKSIENIAHSFSYNFKINITLFRFFTVYGPWGRPDMALYKFTKGINNNKPVEVFNKGNMWRDFTYIDDLVESIYRLKDVIPSEKNRVKNDSLSKICPYRVVNIGNQQPTKLNDFIKILERTSKKKLKRKQLPMQMGDVKYTSADCSLLKRLIGFVPNTPVEKGILNFYNWYMSYVND